MICLKDFKGEIGIIAFNLSGYDFSIFKGDRIAQLVVLPYTRIERFIVSDEQGRMLVGCPDVHPHPQQQQRMTTIFLICV